MNTLLALLLSANIFQVRDTSIRSADLNAYFRSDTALYQIYDDENPNEWGEIFLSVKQFGDGSLAYGRPGAYITYGDLDGDSVEEAVVPFFTGGSIGSCSYAILKNIRNGIQTFFLGNDCVHPFIANDTLHLIRTYHVGYEPDPMGQSSVTLKYRFRGKKRVLVDSQAYGNVRFAHLAVQQFYKRLQAQDYESAYQLLSPSYQKRNAYAKWSAGYKSTFSTSANVERINEADTTVEVEVMATDGAVDNTPVWYKGTWKLIWSGLDRGWLLDEPKIRKVK